MRKKSHISLSRFLLINMNQPELNKYRKSFYFGSILPDCQPSFLTRKHTFEETFDIVCKEIEDLVMNYEEQDGINRKFCRKLGVITHYIADYFTFPHNVTFSGNFKDHCRYEKDLKHKLHDYVKCEEVEQEKKEIECNTVDELLSFIRFVHEQYIMKISEVKKDIQYIVNMCYQVVNAIIGFIEVQFHTEVLLNII